MCEPMIPEFMNRALLPVISNESLLLSLRASGYIGFPDSILEPLDFHGTLSGDEDLWCLETESYESLRGGHFFYDYDLGSTRDSLCNSLHFGLSSYILDTNSNDEVLEIFSPSEDENLLINLDHLVCLMNLQSNFARTFGVDFMLQNPEATDQIAGNPSNERLIKALEVALYDSLYQIFRQEEETDPPAKDLFFNVASLITLLHGKGLGFENIQFKEVMTFWENLIENLSKAQLYFEDKGLCGELLCWAIGKYMVLSYGEGTEGEKGIDLTSKALDLIDSDDIEAGPKLEMIHQISLMESLDPIVIKFELLEKFSCRHSLNDLSEIEKYSLHALIIDLVRFGEDVYDGLQCIYPNTESEDFSELIRQCFCASIGMPLHEFPGLQAAG